MPRNSRDHRITAWIAMRPSYLHQKSCITIDLSRRMLWTVCFSRNTMTKKMLKVNWDCHLGLGHRPCYLGHATRAPRLAWATSCSGALRALPGLWAKPKTLFFVLLLGSIYFLGWSSLQTSFKSWIWSAFSQQVGERSKGQNGRMLLSKVYPKRTLGR